jgi:type IV secretory pathway component VirB8
MATIGFFMLLPLTEHKTMVVSIPDAMTKVARVKQMTVDPSQDANLIVMKWFVQNFVEVREQYDIDKQQQYFKRVYALSNNDVYSKYVAIYKSANSPTVRYERHTKRLVDVDRIDIQNIQVLEPASGNTPEVIQVQAQVRYMAIEASPTEERNSLWQADITFRFSKIHVDQVTGAITPMEFKVSAYESKQLGLE